MSITSKNLGTERIEVKREEFGEAERRSAKIRPLQGRVSSQEIYKALRSEYDGKTWSDEFLRIHITLMRDGQIICWFDLDKEDEDFEEKRDSTISFYDEVVRFLVDRFGEEFKYEDPRISADYIDRNNIHGQYEIVLDDDGENPAVIAIWENEENEMKPRFSENKKIVKEGAGYTEENLIGRKITTAYGADRDPHNAKPATIVDAHRRRVSTGIVFDLTVELDDTGETIEQTFNPLSVGDKYTWGPWFRDGEERQYNPYEREYSESRKLVKEGAGAGYTVEIKGLKFGKIVDYEFEKGEDTYKVKVEIEPGDYEIAANNYYNDFFWQEHDFGDTPTAQIDGGYAIFDIALDGNPDEDDEALFQMNRELENRELDISFDYGAGWMHVDLPREKIEADHVDIDEREVYFGIDKLVLNAPDLADAVNCGYASIFDRDEEGEQVNEVSGWNLEDEDLTLVNSESDGNKLYIVKLWWGSGYQMDCYNAYAFNEEEALNYVVAYIEKNDPETLKAADECAKNLLNEIEQDHISATEMGYDDDFYPEDTPEFQETFIWVDATMEGAKKAHYIYAENLAIAEYPKDHDYPMSKDVNRMDESDYAPLGKGKPRKSKDVIVKVDVEWAGMDSEDDDEQYLDDVGLPGSVYINIPWESYADGELNYDLETKLGNTFDGYVEDYTYRRVEPREVPKGVPIYLWRPEADIMEEF